ncbi:hypothetical protein SK128_004535 [Halocaridina rubra]|uniref:Uncharacterized protein n=1 Tax=Halocaridina rubra TaxID=373956 RepID=A0AAN8XR33_HALRR
MTLIVLYLHPLQYAREGNDSSSDNSADYDIDIYREETNSSKRCLENANDNRHVCKDEPESHDAETYGHLFLSMSQDTCNHKFKRCLEEEAQLFKRNDQAWCHKYGNYSKYTFHRMHMEAISRPHSDVFGKVLTDAHMLKMNEYSVVQPLSRDGETLGASLQLSDKSAVLFSAAGEEIEEILQRTPLAEDEVNGAFKGPIS